MAAPLSKAPPPPPTADQRAQRLKQKRMISTAAGVLVIFLVAWQVYEYVASAEQRAEEQVQAGMKSLTPGHYEQAIKEFGLALETDPNSWNAYLQRGMAKQSLGLRDAALQDFQQALAFKPDLLQARIALADIYRDQGDKVRAVAELTKVIELSPTLDAHYTRGLTFAELGQHQEAIRDFTWIIEEQRDAPLAYFARARSKLALGDAAGSRADDESGMTFHRGSLK